MRFTIPRDFPYKELVEKMIPQNADDFRDKKVIEKTYAVYKDALKLGLNPTLIQYLVYIEVNSVYRGIEKLNDQTIQNIIKQTFFNEQIRQKCKNIDFESDFFSILKYSIPVIEKLELEMKNRRSFQVLKCYQSVLDFLNNEGIPQNLNKSQKIEELQKRYPVTNSSIENYIYRMKNPIYKNEDSTNILSFTYLHNQSLICAYLIKYFYNMLIDYYKQTGYFYRPVQKNFDLFVMGKTVFLTYSNDEELGLYVNDLGKKYDWTTYEFWGAVFNKRINLKDILKFRDFKKIFDHENLIITPKDCLEEAIIKYLNPEWSDNEEYLDYLFKKLGVKKNQDDILDTIDNRIYFKKLIHFELLSLDAKKSKTLEKLIASKTPESYIAKIVALYNGKRAKAKEQLQKLSKSLNKKERRNYID